jgi:tRNA dimethylallyltransferase
LGAVVPEKKIRVPVLLGPTASGKSSIAIQLARELGLDIISCDSRQIYRGMDIGTAKPDPGTLQAAKHWLINIVDPSEVYSGFQFAHDASDILRTLAGKGKCGLICGGTGFYYQCLRRGIGPQIPSDPEFREKYTEKIQVYGAESVHAELAKVDPLAAKRIHANDTQRMIRALEVYHVSHLQMSGLFERTNPPDDFEFLEISLSVPRAELYRRINERAQAMVKAGLWEEFKLLRSRGYNEQSPGMQCVGYRELFAAENNAMDFAQALEKIKQNTRRYAKRQMTWFRTQTESILVDATGKPAFEIILNHIKVFLQKQ